MATILPTKADGSGVVTVVETTMTASDTFTYKQNSRQRLVLTNDTAGALTPVIDGAGSSSENIDGIGAVDVSGGFSVGSMAIGAVVSINTDSIRAYLKGVIEITGASGITAVLMEG